MLVVEITTGGGLIGGIKVAADSFSNLEVEWEELDTNG